MGPSIGARFLQGCPLQIDPLCGPMGLSIGARFLCAWDRYPFTFVCLQAPAMALGFRVATREALFSESSLFRLVSLYLL